MKPLGQEAAQSLASRIVNHMLERDAFSRWLGIEVRAIKPDRAQLRMKVRPDMLNGFGVCHGGVTFAFADSALAFASNTHGKVTVSIENSIHYPAKVVAGDVLEALAEPLTIGKTIAAYQVLVTNQQNEKVGIFRGTVYRTKKPSLP